MIIVAGHLLVEPGERDGYLAAGVEAVEMARAADGCLDFAMSPDPVDPGRINIFERWSAQEFVDRFRGSGPEGAAAAAIKGGAVFEYDVDNERRLL
jgi:quinol monooxygenase YgiN